MPSTLTVITTRPSAQRGPFERALVRLPVKTIECPLTETVSLEAPRFELLNNATWLVLTSKSTVEALRGEICVSRNPGVRVAVVGTSTARLWERVAQRPPDLVAPEGTGRSLGSALAGVASADDRIVVPGAREMQPGLFEELAGAGLRAYHLPLYETRVVPVTEAAAEDLAEVRAPFALVCFFSPSAVRAGFENPAVADVLRKALNLAIGPSTAEELRNGGVAPRIADPHTGQGMLAAVVEWVRSTQPFD